MAHCIQALITKQSVAEGFCDRHSDARLLSLPQDFAIMPVDRSHICKWTGEEPPQSTETFFYVNDYFVSFLMRESEFGRLAYVETEYWGGSGGEGALVVENRELIMQPTWESDAILNAMRLLGVVPLRDTVMFRFANEEAVLGLGDFRTNDDIWDRIGMSDKSGKDARLRAPTPPIDSPLHHHLLRPCRPHKIVLGHQQVTLLGDPW
jgi:hypothetical protein